MIGDPSMPFRIESLPIPSGRWRLAFESPEPIALARLYRDRADESPRLLVHDEPFDVDAGAPPVDVELVPAEASTVLYAMTLERAWP